jgi:hypothetical protein
MGSSLKNTPPLLLQECQMGLKTFKTGCPQKSMVSSKETWYLCDKIWINLTSKLTPRLCHPWKTMAVQAPSICNMSNSRYSPWVISQNSGWKRILINCLIQTDKHTSIYVTRQDFHPGQKKSTTAPLTTAQWKDDWVVRCTMTTFWLLDPYYFEDEDSAVWVTAQHWLRGSDKTEQHTIHEINQHFVANVILHTRNIQWPARSPTIKHHLICQPMTTSCGDTSYT